MAAHSWLLSWLSALERVSFSLDSQSLPHSSSLSSFAVYLRLFIGSYFILVCQAPPPRFIEFMIYVCLCFIHMDNVLVLIRRKLLKCRVGTV